MEIAFIISAILSATAAAYGTVTAYQAAKVQQDQAEANQEIAENNAQMERNAAAMNANTLRRQARARIAAAQARFSTEGNFGESADAVVQDAYVNLASDLASLRFNSENRAIAHENEALMHGYNAKVASKSATSAIIGGSLKTASSVADSAFTGYEKGVFGSGKK